MNPTDNLLTQMRELARRLVADNNDHPDDVAEQACRLAALVLDHDATAADRAHLPVDALIAVTDYLDEHERADYRETPADDRPFHIYRAVITLRRWLRRYLRAERGAGGAVHTTGRRAA